jgi:hypothetical protein
VAISAENPLPTITPRPATELLTRVRSPGLTAGACSWAGMRYREGTGGERRSPGQTRLLSLCD